MTDRTTTARDVPFIFANGDEYALDVQLPLPKRIQAKWSHLPPQWFEFRGTEQRPFYVEESMPLEKRRKVRPYGIRIVG